MALWNRYHTPVTIDEAASLLAQYQGQARVVAGGTDLILQLQQNHVPPLEALVDITRITGFNTISFINNTFTLGAGVTHTNIVKNANLATYATCLVESCGVVGGPQVRNVGTLGGNIAHALPAGDGTTSLVALDAYVEILQHANRRRVHILDMFVGPGKSLLNPTTDILIQVQFAACGPHQGSAFKRMMRPQGVGLPILGCAVWVQLDETDQHITATRLCIGPVAQTPIRARQTEAALIGQPATEATIQQAARVARQELHPRTSKYRATADYRHLMIEVLLRRALPLAIERARIGHATPVFGK